jgi:hypothetical protein
MDKRKKARYQRKRYHDPDSGYKKYILEKSKEYYKKNKDRILEKQKTYNKLHSDEISEYQRKYYLKNREKLIDYSSRRR